MPKTPQRTNRPTKETYHVLIESEGHAMFANATAHVGSMMPFRKPQLTVGMRVSDAAVAFSVLRPTKDTLSKLVERPIAMPVGPLSKLERRSASLGVQPGEVVVEVTTRLPFDKPQEPETPAAAPAAPAAALDDLFAAPAAPAEQAAAPAAGLDDLFAAPAEGASAAPAADAAPRKRPVRPTKTDTYRLAIAVDESGVARITEPGDDDTEIELPRTAMNVAVYLPGPRGRTLAIGWIGYFGKSGKPETLTRIAGMVINSITGLTEFRVLSGIEHVNLGAAPAGARPARGPKPVGNPAFPVKLHLFDAANTAVAEGNVVVTVDLENANPATGRLLTRYEPDAALAEHFDAYRTVLDTAVAAAFQRELGDDAVADIVYDVVLGSVSESTADMLTEIGAGIGALDCNPAQYRPHAG